MRFVSPFSPRAPVVWSRELNNGDETPPSNPRGDSRHGTHNCRAVPLSDGRHILFVDPRTGKLCLGMESPAGSLTRMFRKVWFRPPLGVSTLSPLLYAAGADITHGLRVVALFSIRTHVDRHTSGQNSMEDYDEQLVVFYTVPPDVLHETEVNYNAEVAAGLHGPRDHPGERHTWGHWRTSNPYHARDPYQTSFQDGPAYPLEIQGQAIASCDKIVELAMDASPDMVIWAFSADGWARTWALERGSRRPMTHVAVQEDGSLRHVDTDGDLVLTDAPDVEEDWVAEENDAPDFGFETMTLQESEKLGTTWEGELVRGHMHIDLVEEVSGVARIDVELR